MTTRHRKTPRDDDEDPPARTPDGRYFVVRGRLWRSTNPSLPENERQQLTRDLMRCRARIGRAKRMGDSRTMRMARRKLHQIKVALGERGAVWWTDGTPDYNRYLVKNSPYRNWYDGLQRRSA